MQAGDFEDTVPVDMGAFTSLYCESCGAAHSPDDVAVNVEDGLGWQCPTCNAVNFEEGPSGAGVDGLTEDQRAFLDELDAVGASDYLEEPFGDSGVEETVDDGDLFACESCGEVVTDSEDLEAGMQEGADGSTIWSCPSCGAWNEY